MFVVAVLFRVLALLLAAWALPGGASSSERARTDATPLHALFNPALGGAFILAFGDYLYFGFDQTLMPIWIRHNLGAPVVAIGIVTMLWALPTIVLSPLTGRLADRVRRSTLILVFGLAQVPIYIAYGLASSIVVVAALFVVHSCIYTLVQPAVDAHVAANAPKEARGRVQSLYSAIGILGAFIGANAFAPLYAINWRIPLPVEGVIFGCCVLVGGTLIRASEQRLNSADQC